MIILDVPYKLRKTCNLADN
uniref:Uncharacterized protein n=1 Tax=Arundo donax TaxID=35708 RepID=A0A0A8Z8K0_ARUDO